MDAIGSNTNQSIQTGNSALSDEIANQGVPFGTNPPQSTLLQRFCQKVDQVVTMRGYFRLLAVAVILIGAFAGGPYLLGNLIAIIIGLEIFKISNKVIDEPFFGFSKLFQPSIQSG